MTAFPGAPWAVARRPTALGVVAALVGLLMLLVGAAPAGAATGQEDGRSETEAVGEAITELDRTRDSIDETLRLLDQGRRVEAFAVARTGYLEHYEAVEIALRPIDPDLTLRTEQKFAEIRGLVKTDAPTNEIREQIVELRNLVDDAERTLTDQGLGAPALAFGQA